MRILIFEDEGCTDLAPTALCAAQGHDVVGVSRTMHEAVRLARSAKPDIALVLSLEDGSDNVFLLMHTFSQSGVPSLLMSCDSAPDKSRATSIRWKEAEIAAALFRYGSKLRKDDGGNEGQ